MWGKWARPPKTVWILILWPRDYDPHLESGCLPLRFTLCDHFTESHFPLNKNTEMYIPYVYTPCFFFQFLRFHKLGGVKRVETCLETSILITLCGGQWKFPFRFAQAPYTFPSRNGIHGLGVASHLSGVLTSPKGPGSSNKPECK